MLSSIIIRRAIASLVVLAFMAAIGHSAFAAPAAGSPTAITAKAKKHKKKHRKHKKARRGARGLKGDKGDRGEKGDKGDKGDRGSDGSAVAYAHVNSSGGTKPYEKDAKNISDGDVTHPATGVYCFYNLPEVHNAVANGRHPAGAQPNEYHLAVYVGDDPLNLCPGNESASVVESNGAGALANGEFYILFN